MLKSIFASISNFIFGGKSAKIKALTKELETRKNNETALKTQVAELTSSLDRERSIRAAITAYYKGEGLQIWEVDGGDDPFVDGPVRYYNGIVAAANEDDALILIAGTHYASNQRTVRVTNVTRHFLESQPKPEVDYKTLLKCEPDRRTWAASLNH